MDGSSFGGVGATVIVGISFKGGIVEYVRIKSPTLIRHEIENGLKRI